MVTASDSDLRTGGAALLTYKLYFLAEGHNETGGSFYVDVACVKELFSQLLSRCDKPEPKTQLAPLAGLENTGVGTHEPAALRLAVCQPPVNFPSRPRVRCGRKYAASNITLHWLATVGSTWYAASIAVSSTGTTQSSRPLPEGR